MKKRVLSILLCLCMVLMLCPVAAFADDYRTVTLNFKYGTFCRAGDEPSPYVLSIEIGDLFNLGHVEDCAPYELVGWKESGSGTVYEPDTEINVNPDNDLTFDAVYQVQGSLAVTVNGFEVGKTPADCTYSFESTIPGVTFSEDDIQNVPWAEFVFDGSDYVTNRISNTDVFEADTRYRVVICLDNKGLDTAPAVTVNGKTPEDCLIATRNGVPIQLQIFCTLGTPPMPPLTIDGPDVVCAEQDYEFTVTPPEGVTLDKEFGFDTGGKGSGVDLTIDENGVGHGVMLTEWYDLNTNYFDLSVYGYTADQQFVSATKRVQVSQDHVYVDGVCGCGAVLQYIVEYIGSGDDPICMEVKTHGEPLTLRGETFTKDGYVQTGWVDKETGAVYALGDTYTEDADVTLNPVFEKIITLTVPYTTTVALGDAGEPGETTFMLGLIDGLGNELTFDDQYFFAEITTDGAGSYSGVMTITATEKWLYDMLYEGAFIWQYDGEEDGWTYDDTVWGVRLYMPEVAARSADEASYKLLLYPTYVMDDGCFNLDLNAGPVEEMTFTNIYTKTVTEPTEPTKNSPQTGDNSHMALWIALLLVSGAGVIGTTVYGKKKRAK